MSAAGSGSLGRGSSALPSSVNLSPSVPLLDVNRGNAPLRAEILAAITRVVDSGKFLHGPDVAQLERSVAELCGVEHAIACASGSDALLLALMALEIGPGHEVIVPSFTFFATASAVWRVGARPVFVDIDPRTFNIDPSRIEAAITPKTRAIIPVHLFGQCCEMDAINDLARRRRLFVIEDAAQAIGAKYWGRPACSLGAIGCLSFYPTKNLGAFGDAGMVVTNDDALAERMRILRVHGGEPKYYHSVIGGNFRLDEIQAAVLNVKLPHLESWHAARQRNAAYYDRAFAASGAAQVLTPTARPGYRHIYNQYVIRVPDRDRLRAYLG